MSLIKWYVIYKKIKKIVSFTCFANNFLYVPMNIVPQKNGAVQNDIMALPMHLEYTTDMRDVNVANELWTSYAAQH